MPFIMGIIAFFAGLIKSSIAILGAVWGAKIAVRLVVIGIFITLFLAVLVGLSALVSGLSYVAPTMLSTVWSWVVPSNFVPCATAIISTQVTIWVWKWKGWAIIFTACGY